MWKLNIGLYKMPDIHHKKKIIILACIIVVFLLVAYIYYLNTTAGLSSKISLETKLANYGIHI